jgi:hypothetical protein
MNRHVNNEEHECKTGHVKGRILEGGWRESEEGKGG